MYKCGIKSLSPDEVGRMISLAIPSSNGSNTKSFDLVSLLKSYFAEEVIEKTCFSCFYNNRAKRMAQLCKAPRALVLHLKRFRVTGTNYTNFRKEKISCPVSLPGTIDLEEFCSGLDEAEYKLQSVVRHNSASANYGHYVADVLLQSGKWVCFNDSNVRELDDGLNDTIRREKQGYILYYVKKVHRSNSPPGAINLWQCLSWEFWLSIVRDSKHIEW